MALLASSDASEVVPAAEVATWLTLRLISSVATLCCSRVPAMSLWPPMIEVTRSVASDVSRASSLTSVATTPNPLPASPATAAAELVLLEISWMKLLIP